MKFFRLALVLSAAATCALRAQDDQQQQKAPTEIPDFNNLDEYIYVPKSTLNYGYRYTSGVKASFSGNGRIAANAPAESISSESAPNISRTYHDGTVQPDNRSLITDNGNGSSSSTPAPSDGKTDNWSYDNASQYTSDGFLAFHIYTAQTEDTGTHDKDGKGNAGLEVYVAHDMKKLTKHWEWKIFGGVSVNDIQAATMAGIKANITTQTDTYDLYGQTPPAAPGGGTSSSTTQNVVDANGNQVLESDGVTPVTISINNTVLISDAPLTSSTPPPVEDAVSVVNQYKLHGAYATFRAGPQLIYNFNDHLKVSVSAGPALIYAGSTYQVNEVFNPATGAQIVNTITDTTNKLLLGYYADATLEYDLTDRAGLYVGAFDQSAGSYNQTASSVVGVYSTKVDFSNQDGFRTGLSFKF